MCVCAARPWLLPVMPRGEEGEAYAVVAGQMAVKLATPFWFVGCRPQSQVSLCEECQTWTAGNLWNTYERLGNRNKSRCRSGGALVG